MDSSDGVQATQTPPRLGRAILNRVSELEAREPQPGPVTLVEYQIVRMSGTLLLSFMSTLDQAVMWLPPLGMEIRGPCAGRYRILPDGPWIVRACYPDGFPGPQGAWPEGPELPGAPSAIA